jgi:hypothetical protein
VALVCGTASDAGSAHAPLSARSVCGLVSLMLLAQVLNKYYPPDFDPELLPRNKKPKDRQIEVRIMIPFTLCCSTCKEFSYRGKKFNSKKEIAQDIDYLGLHIHRFQPCFSCCRCLRLRYLRTTALLHLLPPPLDRRCRGFKSRQDFAKAPHRPRLSTLTTQQIFHQVSAMRVRNCLPHRPRDL